MTPAELEQRIDAGVAAAKAAGWTIANSVYFVPQAKECCALSACVLPELERNAASRWPDRSLDNGSLISEQLGLTLRQRVSFTDAFDRCPLLGHHDPEFYELGRRMRIKYIVGTA